MTLDLRALEAAIADADREELPDVLGQLARLQALAQLRLAARPSANGNGRRPGPGPDIQPKREEKLIDVREAAEIMAVKERWLYDRADRLPFTRRPGPRTLRFSKPGLLRWLETRQ